MKIATIPELDVSYMPLNLFCGPQTITRPSVFMINNQREEF